MDFFAAEGLPEHIVIHIMQHLDNSSLLNLAKCNTRLMELLDSKKFASRFSLDLKFVAPWDAKPEEKRTIAEIEEIHQRIVNNSRKYTNLTVKHFVDFIDTPELRPAALGLLEMLGETVKEVTIYENYVDWFTVTDFARMLSVLRNVTKYTLRNFSQNDTGGAYLVDIHFRVEDFQFMEIVEDLELSSCCEYILNAFKSCTNLKRFAMTDCRISGDILIKLLLRQTQLEHLKIAVFDQDEYNYDGPLFIENWRMLNLKLKSLDIYHTKVYLCNLHQAHGFFRFQFELESLGIFIAYNGFGDDENGSETDDDDDDDEREVGEREQLQAMMSIIWSLPKLKNLKMNLFGRGEQVILPETFFNGLPLNNTIEKVTLRCETENFVQLLNSLDAVEEIESDCYHSHLDLSGLQMDVIAKIVKFNENHLTYAPEEVPENSEEFEKIFGQLLKRRPLNDDGLKKIYIGHPSWLRHQDAFQLSLEFCKNLVESAPNVKELKLYNIRDAHGEFAAYLATNKPKTLELIELRTNDPSSKRMKVDDS